MIIIAKDKQAAQTLIEQIQPLADQPVFVHDNRIGTAAKFDVEQLDGTLIAEVITQHHSAIKASRDFHPEDTVIQTEHSLIGGNHFVLMAGPDSIESPEHVLLMGEAVKQSGATILRGGAFKPRTSPYSFQGLGEPGLQAHRAAADALGMDMVTEILDTADVDLVDRYTDIFQVGTRNMQNFALLKALGAKRKPIVLKRGMSATIDDLLNAAEYIAAGGNDQIILMERGIRTFDSKYTRNTLDVSAIPVLKKLTHYPIIADPSHAGGVRDLVAPLALSAVAAGAHGLMIEVHDQPDKAFVDAAQAITPAQFDIIAQQTRQIRTVISEENHAHSITK